MPGARQSGWFRPASRTCRATSSRQTCSRPDRVGRCHALPSRFSSVTAWPAKAGSRRAPTGSPLFEIDRDLPPRSGASSGGWCADRRIPSGSAAGSSRILPSEEECSRFASTLKRRLAPLVPERSVSGAARRTRSAFGELVSPIRARRDHLDVRLERVIGELETYLVVAFAGRSMSDRVGPDLPRQFRSGACAISGRAMLVPSRYCPS